MRFVALVAGVLLAAPLAWASNVLEVNTKSFDSAIGSKPAFVELCVPRPCYRPLCSCHGSHLVTQPGGKPVLNIRLYWAADELFTAPQWALQGATSVQRVDIVSRLT